MPTEHLTDDEKGQLCRALEIEPEGYHYHPPDGAGPYWKWPNQRDTMLRDGYAGKFIEVWPSIDTDPAWAEKVMEAAVDRLGYRMAVAVTGDRIVKAGRWNATGYDGVPVFAKTMPLALCRAALAALDAGELEMEAT